jgi:hypothetical protein
MNHLIQLHLCGLYPPVPQNNISEVRNLRIKIDSESLLRDRGWKHYGHTTGVTFAR